MNIFSERGRRLYSFRTLRVPTTAGVTRGDEVAVSRIVPGRDTFESPLRLSMHRQAEKSPSGVVSVRGTCAKTFVLAVAASTVEPRRFD